MTCSPKWLGVPVAILATATSLSAQAVRTLPVGAQVRFRDATAAEWQSGVELIAAGDTLRMTVQRPGPDTVRTLRVRTLFALERRTGGVGTFGQHVVIGAALGVLVSGLWFAHRVRRCDAQAAAADGPPCGLAWGVYPLVAAGSGALGAVVGSLLPARRWEPVALPGD